LIPAARERKRKKKRKKKKKEKEKKKKKIIQMAVAIQLLKREATRWPHLRTAPWGGSSNEFGSTSQEFAERNTIRKSAA